MPQANSLALFEEDGRALRDPAQVIPLPSITPFLAPERLAHRVRGDFWGVLARLGIRLLVTREYEHLLLSLGVSASGRPEVSWLPLPHPSGVAVDRRTGDVTVALTRNPNQLLVLASRRREGDESAAGVLLPARTTFLSGSTYLHDLAYIGNRLHAAAVGKNLIAAVDADGALVPRWWPEVMSRDGVPDNAGTGCSSTPSRRVTPSMSPSSRLQPVAGFAILRDTFGSCRTARESCTPGGRGRSSPPD